MTQLTLTPEEPIKTTALFLKRSQLKLTLYGRVPDANLIASIRVYGVLQPIIVEQIGDTIDYNVIEGRRRILSLDAINELPDKSALEPEEANIPSCLVPPGWAELIQLTTHATRGNNPAAELQQIEALEAKGASETDIARATGMAVGTIRARKKLLSLNVDLRLAFDRGKLTKEAAEAAAKLDVERQESLAKRFREGERITAKLVAQERQARRDAVELPMDQLLDIPSNDPWQAVDLSETPANPADYLPRQRASEISDVVSLLREWSINPIAVQAGDLQTLADKLEASFLRSRL